MPWTANHADQIELFHLTPYAPERNPDEYVNNDVEPAMARRSTPLDKARSCFQAPDARHAA